tara:strand:+ start:332 stop:487 length:156 start_codon:yes stop_codon:yes gene_type:complete
MISGGFTVLPELLLEEELEPEEELLELPLEEELELEESSQYITKVQAQGTS